MGKIETFHIIFDTKTWVFLPGEIVSGHIFLNLSKAIKTKSITLHVIGQAHSQWTCNKHAKM